MSASAGGRGIEGFGRGDVSDRPRCCHAITNGDRDADRQRDQETERPACEHIGRPVDREDESRHADGTAEHDRRGDGRHARQRATKHEHGDDDSERDEQRAAVGRVAGRERGLRLGCESQRDVRTRPANDRLCHRHHRRRHHKRHCWRDRDHQALTSPPQEPARKHGDDREQRKRPEVGHPSRRRYERMGPVLDEEPQVRGILGRQAVVLCDVFTHDAEHDGGRKRSPGGDGHHHPAAPRQLRALDGTRQYLSRGGSVGHHGEGSDAQGGLAIADRSRKLPRTSRCEKGGAVGDGEKAQAHHVHTTFEAPGPGGWMLLGDHFAGAVTPEYQRIYAETCPAGMAAYMERYGVLARSLAVAFVHGHVYIAPIPLAGPREMRRPPPRVAIWLMARLHPAFRRRTRAAARTLAERPWRDVAAYWFSIERSEWAARNVALERVDPAQLDDESLRAHLATCRAHAVAGYRRHFELHGDDLLPVGLLLARCAEWGIDAATASTALVGASPDDVVTAEPAAWQLVTGYDLDSRAACEIGRVEHMRRAVPPASTDLRELVPAEHHAELACLVDDARLVIPLRDDNGAFTGAWPLGLLRRAMLECGRRIGLHDVE